MLVIWGQRQDPSRYTPLTPIFRSNNNHRRPVTRLKAAPHPLNSTRFPKPSSGGVFALQFPITPILVGDVLICLG